MEVRRSGGTDNGGGGSAAGSGSAAETDNHGRYELLLEVDGAPVRIEAEIQRPVGTVSYLTPNHMTIGVSSSPRSCQVVREHGTRFTWDGDVGYGHTQRSTSARL